MCIRDSIGAGLGESARASVMTRGFAELSRLAIALGARPETLAGLSGLGDLALTCSSPQSRNFRYGLSLADPSYDPPSTTIEGRTTAKAALQLAVKHNISLPITEAAAKLISGQATVRATAEALLSRALKEE